MEQTVTVVQEPIVMGELPIVATKEADVEKVETSRQDLHTLITPVSVAKSKSLFVETGENLSSFPVESQLLVAEPLQLKEMSSFQFHSNKNNDLPNLPKLVQNPLLPPQISRMPKHRRLSPPDSQSPQSYGPPPLSYSPPPKLRLANISSLSEAQGSSTWNSISIPPDLPPAMPPLLRLPSPQTSFEIPVASSGPSKSLVHQTPTQAIFAQNPVIANLDEHHHTSSLRGLLQTVANPFPTTLPGNQQAGTKSHLFPSYSFPSLKSGYSADSTVFHPLPLPESSGPSTNSFSVSIPIGDVASISYPSQLPGGPVASGSTSSYPLTLPGGSTEQSVVISEDSSELDVSSGEVKDPNNAAKCREYRERSRAKKAKELHDFQYEHDRNRKLKAAYDKKTDTIRKLKAYYIKCLQDKKYRCVDAKKEETANASLESMSLPSKSSLTAPTVKRSDEGIAKTSDSSLPMVTIKSEEIANLIDVDVVKTECDGTENL